MGPIPTAAEFNDATPHATILAVMAPVVPESLPDAQLVPYLHYILADKAPAVLLLNLY
jgi:hypothetical protein